VSTIEPASEATGEKFALGRLEAVERVPDQMADAAEHVMDQRPGVAEQDQPADQAADEPFDIGIGIGPEAAAIKPPGEQQHAEIQRRAVTRWTMDIIIVSSGRLDLQVRRQRALAAGARARLHVGHRQTPRRLPATPAVALRACASLASYPIRRDRGRRW